MTARIMLAAGALLASTSAWAQAAPAQAQGAQELACQLSDECDNAAASPAEAAGPAAPSGARISATRGFKIARKTDSSTGSADYATTKSGAKPRVAYEGNKKALSGAPGKSKAALAANAKPMPKGRADLRVSFVSGSAELTAAGQREAQTFAAALASPLLEGKRFTIEGHTDAVGNREYNLDLSRRRAQAVVDYLVGKGIDRSRFDVAGYGFDRPLSGTAATAAVNRRVEVVRNK
jgi:OmpA-OmpF porin, OOP family